MRHLTSADYIRMPWANGRGETIEILKEVDAEGMLLWRLSVATVSEDGPFSLFPGIDRVLTVIEGPGFDVVGEGLVRTCALWVPVSFPGELPVRAERTGGKVSRDLNVMTARDLPRPEVAVMSGWGVLSSGGLLCLYALGPSEVEGLAVGAGELVLTERGARVNGTLVVVRLFRAPPTPAP